MQTVTVESLQAEIAILVHRIKSESEVAVETFKHDLSRTLRVDYADFSMSKDIPMTPELGEAYRDLLGAMFARLQKQGINLQ